MATNSALETADYDAVTRVLTLKYQSGRAVRVSNLTAEQAARFMARHSKGQERNRSGLEDFSRNREH
jgi:hypothetical protein